MTLFEGEKSQQMKNNHDQEKYLARLFTIFHRDWKRFQ